MPRSVWAGSISFGLVNIPVKLLTATKDRGIHFRMLHAEDGQPIKTKRVCSKDGKELERGDIIKGYEVSKGRFVLLDDEEIEAADPQGSRTIDILDFVELADIDPAFFDKPYFLAPEQGAERPYALLHKALGDSGRVGVARMVMRGNEYLVALRPQGDMLMLVTLRFSEEVVPVSAAAAEFTVKADVGERELKMARQLVDTLSDHWEPTRYENEHRQRLLTLIDQKLEGKTIAVEAPHAPPKTADILSALEESVKRAQQRMEEEKAEAT